MAELSPRTVPQRCPFCHEGFEQGPSPLVCKACSAWHHLGCVAETEKRRCGACGGSTLHDRSKKAAGRSWALKKTKDPFVAGLGTLMLLAFLVSGIIFERGARLEVVWVIIASTTSVALLGYLVVRVVLARLRGGHESQIGKVRRRSAFRPRSKRPREDTKLDEPESPKKVRE